ncbi:MAG: ATP-binding protein [Pirellulaceae bacterium]
MISTISIRNFKSYVSADLPLAPLTFLVGANASGKSNALEAIRLLSWLAKGQRLDQIAKEIQGADALVRGQAADLYHRENQPLGIGCEFSPMPEDWSRLDVEIRLLADQLVISGEKVSKPGILSMDSDLPLYKIDGIANPHTDEIRVMYNNFKQGGNKPHIPCSNRMAIFHQLETPSRFEKKHEESRKLIPDVCKRIRESLQRVFFLDPRPSTMRGYSFEKNDEIEEDGRNLSSVLFKICRGEGKGKADLLEFIKSLPEQNIADIKFIETDRRDVMVRLVESFGGVDKTIDAPLLSDGTLRVLAVAAILLSAPAESLVIIEEIDNGVHPSRANGLVRQIQKISQERNLKVLVTTHNPALLDSLPDNALADVLCSYRDPEKGDSRVVRLGDLPRYPEVVALGTLGEIVTNRVLDRFLKDETTKEQRKRQSLQWLEGFKSEVAE